MAGNLSYPRQGDLFVKTILSVEGALLGDVGEKSTSCNEKIKTAVRTWKKLIKILQPQKVLHMENKSFLFSVSHHERNQFSEALL